MNKVLYKSTRGKGNPVSASEAILKGIASDGGLYVPTYIPKPRLSLEEMKKLDYKGLVYEIMKDYLSDFSEAELKKCIENAYDEKFDTPVIAPLVKKSGVYFLELFHGPTLAFKDMALSILPHLLKTAAAKQNMDKEIVILTATSGDTGKAALEGFANVPGTRIIVFFPEDGVSDIQKRQMITQKGDNTHVIGIKGNFDDAQNGVKQMFTDAEMIEKMEQKGYMFSSANSINIGRLIPQIAYYFHGYLQLCKMGEIETGDEVNFTVPTGNFGNILAGYYAMKMGLPIKKLLCASNENKVLFDFFSSGIYDRKREFKVTMSPSMDILISSNLERLLYFLSGEDSEKVTELMQLLKSEGKYEITNDMKEKMEIFLGGYASEAKTAEAIRKVYQESGYIIDTHTAVAYSVYLDYSRQNPGDGTKSIIVSTASPYKFTVDVLKSLGLTYPNIDSFGLLKEMSRLASGEIPEGIRDIDKKPVLHKTVCEKQDMKKEVEKILKL